MRPMRRLVPAIALLVALDLPAADEPPKRWFKGNTHTHTLNSDGDSTPDEVVRWYREHGYNFLVLSDHNFLTSVDGLNGLHAADGQFLVIAGEEVSDLLEKKPIHVNGLGLEKRVAPQGGATVAEVLQRNIDAVRGAKGVPHVNHPNYVWAIAPGDLQKVQGYRLLEIYNGHPLVNNDGAPGSPSVEAIWDMLLSAGKRVYAIAVDDAHTFKEPWNPGAARPGRGWVVVRSATLDTTSLLHALEEGDFYASTGVELKDVEATPAELAITIKNKGDTRFTTQFIGREGTVLATTGENPARYAFRGHETYVRARITDSNGARAWVQPVFPGKEGGASAK